MIENVNFASLIVLAAKAAQRNAPVATRIVISIQSQTSAFKVVSRHSRIKTKVKENASHAWQTVKLALSLKALAPPACSPIFSKRGIPVARLNVY